VAKNCLPPRFFVHDSEQRTSLNFYDYWGKLCWILHWSSKFFTQSDHHRCNSWTFKVNRKFQFCPVQVFFNYKYFFRKLTIPPPSASDQRVNYTPGIITYFNNWVPRKRRKLRKNLLIVAFWFYVTKIFFFNLVECLSGGMPFNLSSTSLNKVVPMSTPIAFSRPNNSVYASSPPSSSGIHYSTLVSDGDVEGSQMG